MKSLILASVLIFSGVTSFASSVSVSCKIQSIDLNNMAWNIPTPRVFLDCLPQSWNSKKYLDFYYTNKNIGSSILSQISAGDTVDLKVSLSESVMYTYPDVVIAIKTSTGFSTEIDRQEWLMFVSSK